MELREVAAVSGRSGLFKIVKPTKTGVILETIEASPKRIVAGASEKVSILNEISIYTTDSEGSVALEQVFQAIKKNFPSTITVTGKSSPDELKAFLLKVLPNFDQERVYASDIKKLATWFTLLNQFHPEVFEAKATEAKQEVAEETPAKEPAKKKATKAVEATADSGEEKPKAAKKPAAKKAAKKSAE